LRRHLKLDHRHVLPEGGRFVCEVCGKRHKLAKELIKHYEEHGANIETEWKEFHNWESFLKWKEAEEETTHTFFVRPKGATTSGLDEG